MSYGPPPRFRPPGPPQGPYQPNTDLPAWPRRRRSAEIRWVALAVLAAFAVGIMVGYASHAPGEASGNEPVAAVTLPSDSQPSEGQPAPAPAYQPAVQLDKRGNGQATTQTFDVQAQQWEIRYAYDCSRFGQAGNFAIEIYGSHGGYVDLAVNAQGNSGKDHTYEHGAGTFYLSITSECSWHVRVIG